MAQYRRRVRASRRGGQGQPAAAAFLALAARHGAGDSIALVVHGGTIMCLLEALEESRQLYRWQVPNGGGFRCQWDGERLAVEAGIE